MIENYLGKSVEIFWKILNFQVPEALFYPHERYKKYVVLVRKGTFFFKILLQKGPFLLKKEPHFAIETAKYK